MEAIKKILRTPSAFVLLLVAIVTLIGIIIKGEFDKSIVRIPIDATLTAEAKLTENAITPNPTQSIIFTETPIFTLANLTSTATSIVTDTPSISTSTSSVSINLKCSDNLLTEQWRLESTDNADEAWIDFSDQYILKDKKNLRITYNLHGLIAQMGDRKNDSAIVFNQPNWYGISLADPKYGTNGLDGEQTVDIPLSDFVELPNPDAGIDGGKPLDLNAPVSSIRARFWHTGHFIVDITSIAVCSPP